MNGANASIEFNLINVNDTPAHVQKREFVYKQEVKNIEEFDPDLVLILSGWEVETDYIYEQLFPLLEPWALRTGNKVILQDADILQFQSDTAGSMDTIVSLLEIT